MGSTQCLPIANVGGKKMKPPAGTGQQLVKRLRTKCIADINTSYQASHVKHRLGKRNSQSPHRSGHNGDAILK
jgi:hypothetical protein